MNSKPKIYVVGHGRHGKDTAAQIISDVTGLTFESSSMFCARLFIYEALRPILGYASVQECYDDRSNHRALWHGLITSYNLTDPARLSREIFSEYDMYVGIRSRVELEAAREEGLVDLVFWVDASRREEPEPADSFSLDISCADFVIDNNRGEGDMTRNVETLFSLMTD